jgi:hypothetical protein
MRKRISRHAGELGRIEEEEELALQANWQD